MADLTEDERIPANDPYEREHGVAKRLRALGLASFKDYCALVATREGLDERQKMLAALTTNVTRFFRDGDATDGYLGVDSRAFADALERYLARHGG